ncbi:MAG: hypothetical protein R3C68_01115 [Myxococcota bacterium]
MAVEGIDVNLQSLISGARQLETQKQIDEQDKGSDEIERINRKIQIKKELLKQKNVKVSLVQRETFQRQSDVQGKLQLIQRGGSGPEAALALHDWQNNQHLQSKLTEHQRNYFREAMVNDPGKVAKSARALHNVATQPGFEKAVRTSQQMGVLQKALVDDPRLEKRAANLLRTSYMRSPKADHQTKNRFMEFGLRQNKAQVERAGDLLGVLAQKGIGRTGQQAALGMVQRNPDNAEATSNVDAFVAHPDIGQLPTFARSKSTELLAKADGQSAVKNGFEALAGDAKFKSQTADNKGRFFSTIGSGKTSEFRAYTDKLLQSLQNPGFPKRGPQVQRFLGKVSQQIQQGGAQGIDTAAALKAAKSSLMPRLALLPISDDMTEEEKSLAGRQNRANVIQYFTKYQRILDQADKKLNAAKYFEDVNALSNMREPDNIDISVLAPEERALYNERHQKALTQLDGVRRKYRDKARLLRTQRMPPRKRQAMRERARILGRQPKYFDPQALLGHGQNPTEAFLGQSQTKAASGLASTAARAQRASRNQTGIAMENQIHQALNALGETPLTPENAGQIVQTIAAQVARQVATEVTQQLLGRMNASAAPSQQQDPSPAQETSPATSHRLDGFGIPRALDRDLGGTQRPAVTPKLSHSTISGDVSEAADQEAEVAYRGKTLVKDSSSIRDIDTLFRTGWRDLGRGEKALLKNLGWSQRLWDAKDSGNMWPTPMMTLMVNLTPTQRESVRKLGFSDHAWDKRVQPFTMSKNA